MKLYTTATVTSVSADEFSRLLNQEIDAWHAHPIDVQFSTCVRGAQVFYSAVVLVGAL